MGKNKMKTLMQVLIVWSCRNDSLSNTCRWSM